MIVAARAAIKDHWSNWTSEMVPPPWTAEKIKNFQDQLDKISGKSRGKSILKLEWGGNATTQKYVEWDSSGNPTRSIKVLRHAIPRRSAIMPELVTHIPIRRWIITQLSDPGQHKPEDLSDVTFIDESGRACVAGEKEVFLYTPYIYVGDHSNCPKDCCDAKLCLGDYKIPDSAELNYIREITYKLARDFKYDPYNPLTGENIEEIRNNYNYEQEKRREAEEIEFDDESKDWFNAHKHRLTDEDPSVLQHGRFHIFKDGKPI